jgi:hypothetical protein
LPCGLSTDGAAPPDAPPPAPEPGVVTVGAAAPPVEGCVPALRRLITFAARLRAAFAFAARAEARARWARNAAS